MIVFTAFRAVNMNVLTQFGAFNGLFTDNYSAETTTSYTMTADGGFPVIVAGGHYFSFLGTLVPSTTGEIQSLLVKNDGVINTYQFTGLSLQPFTFHVTLNTATSSQDIVDTFLNVDNLINGSSFSDILNGQDGADLIKGNAGIDTLLGGNQADTLVGGGGRDFLTGGSARDIFDYNAVSESLPGANRDQILDFHHAENDDIDLRNIDADIRSANPGNDVFTFIGSQTFAAFHAAHPGIFGMVRIGGNGIVQITNDGDLAAEMEIKAVGATNANDYLL